MKLLLRLLLLLLHAQRSLLAACAILLCMAVYADVPHLWGKALISLCLCWV